jgi:hypothetical protein
MGEPRGTRASGIDWDEVRRDLDAAGWSDGWDGLHRRAGWRSRCVELAGPCVGPPARQYRASVAEAARLGLAVVADPEGSVLCVEAGPAGGAS